MSGLSGACNRRGWNVRGACHALWMCIGVLLLCQCGAPGRGMHHDVIAYGAFARLRIYRPQGPTRHVAVLLSGDGGWGAPLDAIASGLAGRGSLVAGIDTREWLAALNRSGSPCIEAGGALADLGHYLNEHYPVPAQAPVLIGHSAGASLAYVALAQSAPADFAGALTLSFCADLDLARPLCPAGALREGPRASGVRLRRQVPGSPFMASRIASARRLRAANSCKGCRAAVSWRCPGSGTRTVMPAAGGEPSCPLMTPWHQPRGNPWAAGGKRGAANLMCARWTSGRPPAATNAGSCIVSRCCGETWISSTGSWRATYFPSCARLSIAGRSSGRKCARTSAPPRGCSPSGTCTWRISAPGATRKGASSGA